MRILDVLVPETVEQLVKLPKTVTEDGIQQRIVERIAEIPVRRLLIDRGNLKSEIAQMHRLGLYFLNRDR